MDKDEKLAKVPSSGLFCSMFSSGIRNLVLKAAPSSADLAEHPESTVALPKVSLLKGLDELVECVPKLHLYSNFLSYSSTGTHKISCTDSPKG
jgi:hypothetical protein